MKTPAAIALREAMLQVAKMQKSPPCSAWRFNTEIIAWDLMLGCLDETAKCWRGDVGQIFEIRFKLQQLHPLVDGWWVEGDEDFDHKPVFIDAAAWKARREIWRTLKRYSSGDHGQLPRPKGRGLQLSA